MFAGFIAFCALTSAINKSIVILKIVLINGRIFMALFLGAKSLVPFSDTNVKKIAGILKPCSHEKLQM